MIHASQTEIKQTSPLLKGYDPELLYVECQRCGRPVLWEPGRTTKVLNRAGVETALLDNHCLIMSNGCPGCSPGQDYYDTKVVRLRETLFVNSNLIAPTQGTA